MDFAKVMKCDIADGTLGLRHDFPKGHVIQTLSFRIRVVGETVGGGSGCEAAAENPPGKPASQNRVAVSRSQGERGLPRGLRDNTHFMNHLQKS
jgi:hypothetical protein